MERKQIGADVLKNKAIITSEFCGIPYTQLYHLRKYAEREDIIEKQPLGKSV